MKTTDREFSVLLSLVLTNASKLTYIYHSNLRRVAQLIISNPSEGVII